MRSFWNGRNVRIIVAVVLVTWVVCICTAVVIGLAMTRYGGGVNLSAATVVPVTGTQINVSPGEGYSGTELVINGENWRPGDVVFVRLQNQAGETDENYAYAGAVADENGQFSVSFIYPYDPRWAQEGVVQVRSSCGGIRNAGYGPIPRCSAHGNAYANTGCDGNANLDSSPGASYAAAWHAHSPAPVSYSTAAPSTRANDY